MLIPSFKMRMRRIGVDVDDVLFEFMNPFLEFMNPIYGTDFTREQIKIYDLIDVFGISKEEMSRRLDEFTTDSRLYSLRPISGAKKGMASLKQRYDVYIVTSRKKTIREATLGSLRLSFPCCFSQVLFANSYVHKDGKPKSQVCLGHGIELLIDDSYVFTNEYALLGGKSLLLDSPWNQGETHELVTRVKNWAEIVEKLRA